MLNQMGSMENRHKLGLPLTIQNMVSLKDSCTQY